MVTFSTYIHLFARVYDKKVIRYLMYKTIFCPCNHHLFSFLYLSRYSRYILVANGDQRLSNHFVPEANANVMATGIIAVFDSIGLNIISLLALLK